MRYAITAALAITAGCAHTNAEQTHRDSQLGSIPNVVQVGQLLEENATLLRLLAEKNQPHETDRDRDTARQRASDRQKALECMLAEIRAVQQCAIWYRNEAVGTLFDQKMIRCVAQRNYFEARGDCARTR